MISVTGMDETLAIVETMILKTSRLMRCAAPVKEVQVEHAMTPTKALVTLAVTNVNGTTLIQVHAGILIQINSLLAICAAFAEAELAQVETGKSLNLVIMRSSI